MQKQCRRCTSIKEQWLGDITCTCREMTVKKVSFKFMFVVALFRLPVALRTDHHVSVLTVF